MRGKSRHVRVRVDAIVLLDEPIDTLPKLVGLDAPGDVVEATCRALGFVTGGILLGARVSVALTTARPRRAR